MLRRTFIRLMTGLGSLLSVNIVFDRAAAAQSAKQWHAGPVRHILPTASDKEFLIKISFQMPLKRRPVLQIDNMRVQGEQTDSKGQFWQFRASNLRPSHLYQLCLFESKQVQDVTLCDPWTLKTFPSAIETPDFARLLFYTCAGGDERNGFLPAEIRNRLLRRALSFKPDAVIANGDHIYMDLRPQRHRQSGGLIVEDIKNRELPVLGTASEDFVKQVGERQISSVYGVDFRSVPTFFIQDDHDYFDNDEASEKLVTFPPDAFMTELARVTQHLFYPEFLPDPNRPEDLPGTRGTDDDHPAVSTSFGTLRYGALVEALLYTIRKNLTMTGKDAQFLALNVEGWIFDRIKSDDTHHQVHVPSGPFGWTAGKWGEWYPDHFKNGEQVSDPPKPYWQRGWLRQHDRLLSAISAIKHRIPLIISGDLHATALGQILRSGNVDMKDNPVTTVLSGTIGTGASGWPSRSRGIPPLPSKHLKMDEQVKPIEQHGFTIAEFTPQTITLKLFVWDIKTQAQDDIENLEPVKIVKLRR